MEFQGKDTYHEAPALGSELQHGTIFRTEEAPSEAEPEAANFQAHMRLKTTVFALSLTSMVVALDATSLSVALPVR